MYLLYTCFAFPIFTRLANFTITYYYYYNYYYYNCYFYNYYYYYNYDYNYYYFYYYNTHYYYNYCYVDSSFRITYFSNKVKPIINPTI